MRLVDPEQRTLRSATSTRTLKLPGYPGYPGTRVPGISVLQTWVSRRNSPGARPLSRNNANSGRRPYRNLQNCACVPAAEDTPLSHSKRFQRQTISARFKLWVSNFGCEFGSASGVELCLDVTRSSTPGTGVPPNLSNWVTVTTSGPRDTLNILSRNPKDV
eukprot:127488-Rhodomonas_salina.1